MEHHHEHEHCHDHEHEHEHHHDHEHEHEHHHEHGPIEISHHDGALIGAVRGLIPGADFDAAERRLSEQMEAAAARITDAGGIIGHIKFLLCAEGRCAQLSVTDADAKPQVRHFDGAGCRLEGVAIVFAVEEETLHEILEETVASLLAEEG